MKTESSTDYQYWRFWLFAVLGFIGALWLLSGMLMPFVLALAIAYLLNPLVSRMCTFGVPRWLGALIVLLLFITIITTATILLAPIVQTQVVELANSLPGYIETLQKELWPRIKDVLEHIPTVDATKLQDTFSQYTNDIVKFVGKVLGQVVTGSMALLDILALLVLTPVVAFYLMRDWPKILGTVDGYLPVRHAPAIRHELQNIDTMIAGFIRGQAMVSLVLAIFYSITLSLAGLKYGMVIGLISGFLSFIPIVGTLTGIIASLIMAFVQFDQASQIGVIALIFLIAQILDGYFLTPKLVGDRVGLHPVWIIFAVLAGGKLLGLVGVILAVPFAGTIAILIRLMLRQYRRSRYFSPIPPSGV
ncbi:MAG: AI-2E family transporter [Alphaproteobacteria bacterium]|nr:AI-2E family transporter [Alphaproteobacteria bacterium]